MGFLGSQDVKKELATRFVCSKCHSQGARVKSVAMTGTGLSRLLDFQHNQYVFVSCERCGFTEVYDDGILSNASHSGMNILDLLFGS